MKKCSGALRKHHFSAATRKMVSDSPIRFDQSPIISSRVYALIAEKIKFVASSADVGFYQYGSNFPLESESPAAKKSLHFSSPDENLESPAVAVSGDRDGTVEDEETLINLRQKAHRQRKAKGKKPMVPAVSRKEVPALEVPRCQPGLAQVATRRFTRSRPNQTLAALCPPKKRVREDLHQEQNAANINVRDNIERSPAKSGNKVPSQSLPRSSVFRSSLHQDLWPFVCARSFRREHTLVPAKVKHLGIVDVLKDLGILNTVLNVPSFVKNVVLEFYCNLSTEINDIKSEHFHQTFVRGGFVNFSPQVINEFVGSVPFFGVTMEGGMDIVVAEITGGLLTSWPDSGGIRASCLSYTYSVLHKVALRNWMPNTHSSVVRQGLALVLYQIGTKGSFNFGQLVFDQVVKHAEKQVVGKPLGFPSLIFGIIQSQQDVLKGNDVFEPNAPLVVITDKLRNAAYHVNDAPTAVITDDDVVYSQPQSFSDEGLQDFQKELIVRELELQSAYLGRLIKSSQSRKSMLDALLADLRKHAAANDTAEGDASPSF